MNKFFCFFNIFSSLKPAYLAKTVANEINSKFLSVNCREFCSKSSGENEKYIRDIFQIVLAHAPIILFIEELNYLFSKEDYHEYDKRSKVEFLIQFDSINSSNINNIFIIGSTNVPWDLMPAARRRY
jgi:SpoVK/Ycf46/Vps4 family AAA+-type ATPase